MEQFFGQTRQEIDLEELLRTKIPNLDISDPYIKLSIQRTITIKDIKKVFGESLDQNSLCFLPNIIDLKQKILIIDCYSIYDMAKSIYGEKNFRILFRDIAPGDTIISYELDVEIV